MMESVSRMTVVRVELVVIVVVPLALMQVAGLGCQWLNLEKCSSKFSKCSGHTHRMSQTGFWLCLLY